MSQYTITVDDIKAFIATRAPNQHVGSRASGTGCLVAKALEHKYGMVFIVGLDEYGIENQPFAPLPKDIAVIVDQFDAMIDLSLNSITRQEVEDAIPELRQEETNA